jgi:uncharacterized protein YkwD
MKPRPNRRSRTALHLSLLACALLALPSVAAAGDDPAGRLPEPLAGYPLPLWLEPPIRGTGPSFEELVMERVNQERWTNGQLPPLKNDPLLDQSSEVHSANMASRDFFGHCDLVDLTLPGDRMTAVGYLWNSLGENVAAGQSTPQSVMDSWMGSSGHRANILSTDFREVGIGYVLDASDQGNVDFDADSDCTADSSGHGPYFHYWTQNFGRRSNVYPVVIDREAYLTESRDVDLYLYGTGFAVEMRIRNETGGFTPWMPFAADVPWTLTSGSGVKEVTVEIRSGGGTVRSASDTIVLEDTDPEIFSDGFESGDTSAWSSG